jgi:hypothetical protein
MTNGKPLKEILSKALSFKCSTKVMSWNKGLVFAKKTVGPFTVSPDCKQPGFVVGYFYPVKTKNYGAHLPIKSVPSYPVANSNTCTGTIKPIAGGYYEITCSGGGYPKNYSCSGSVSFICCETTIDL